MFVLPLRFQQQRQQQQKTGNDFCIVSPHHELIKLRLQRLYRSSCNFRSTFFKLIAQNNSLATGCHIALRSMSKYCTNEKSLLVQVMACRRQATSHYLSQCSPRSMSSYGVTGPRRVNSLWRQQVISWNNAALPWLGHSRIRVHEISLNIIENLTPKMSNMG